MIFLLLGLLICSSINAQEAELSVHVIRSNKEKPAVKTKLALVQTNKDRLLDEITQILQEALQESGQCEATVLHDHLPKTKQDLTTYDAAGYQFVLFLGIEDNQAITGRIYDALDAHMLQGKKWQRREPTSRWAHTIAQDIWQQLMGHAGSFLSKIAYVKKTKDRSGKIKAELCVIGWNGADEKTILKSNSIFVAPTWNYDGERIFCSQFTDHNVRLIATDLHGKSWVVINRDGTTMAASSAPGSSDVVYCHSGEIWKCSYDAQHKRSMHQMVIRDGALCASPTLLATGDIIYCAGGRIKQWHATSGKTTLITDEGYCTGPAYHAPSRRIAYSKRVGKQMQLCIHDMRTGTNRQVTHGGGDKIDASWSPCGSYLAYCLGEGKNSEVMILNMITGTQRRISAPGNFCSCPAWSPRLGS